MKLEEYSEFTKEYLGKVEEYLISKYGEVKPEWDSILFLLAENLDLYFECKKQVVECGIYDYSTKRKNPLLSTMKDLQATILKEVQHLGISPYSASKIKQEIEEDNENYIDVLTR